jgi:hypothetical protein
MQFAVRAALDFPAQEATQVAFSAALSGSSLKAPGFAGGYLLCPRRRDPQSAAHAPRPRRGGARPAHARWTRHARQPGRGIDPALVRDRRRGERDAGEARGIVWSVGQRPC